MSSIVSASKINKFHFCQIAYKKTYIDKVDGEENIYMIFGKVIHAALELNFKQKITSKKDLDSKKIVSFFEITFRKEAIRINARAQMRGETAVDTLLLQGALMLEKYINQIAPKTKPSHVELEFSLPLKSFPLTLHGFIDRIDEDDYIWDYKTVPKLWKRDWTQSRLDNDIQFTVYAAAFRKMFGRKEKGIKVQLLPRSIPVEFPILTTTRNDEDVHRVLSYAAAMNLVRDNGLFMPNFTSCPTCFFKKDCKMLPEKV